MIKNLEEFCKKEATISPQLQAIIILTESFNISTLVRRWFYIHDPVDVLKVHYYKIDSFVFKPYEKCLINFQCRRVMLRADNRKLIDVILNYDQNSYPLHNLLELTPITDKKLISRLNKALDTINKVPKMNLEEEIDLETFELKGQYLTTTTIDKIKRKKYKKIVKKSLKKIQVCFLAKGLLNNAKINNIQKEFTSPHLQIFKFLNVHITHQHINSYPFPGDTFL